MKRPYPRSVRSSALFSCCPSTMSTLQPVLKLPQGQALFYEISRIASVGNLKRQGTLPHFTPMHTQPCSDRSTSPYWQRSAPAASPSLRPEWHSLPIAWLGNFERIDYQFVGYGVQFADAIAICPSNPKFLPPQTSLEASPEASKVLMPGKQGLCLELTLKRPVSRVHLGTRGSQPVTISALNDQGHCVVMARTPQLATASEAAHPEYKTVIDVTTASVIRIDSKAPFILTQLALK